MRHWRSIALGVATIVAALVVYSLPEHRDAGALASAPNPALKAVNMEGASPHAPEMATIPAGTKIQIRLVEARVPPEISSGAKFSAYLYGPLWINSQFLAPSRSEVTGEFVKLDWGNAAANGMVTMVLQKLMVGGKKFRIETDPLALLAMFPEGEGFETGAHSSEGRRDGIGLAAKWITEVSRAKSPFTFTLSAPVALPVIRKIGGTFARKVHHEGPVFLEASRDGLP